jgi:hypothetical protein
MSATVLPVRDGIGETASWQLVTARDTETGPSVTSKHFNHIYQRKHGAPTGARTQTGRNVLL